MTVILLSFSNTPVASLFPHLPGLLTEAAHLHEDEPVFQSGHLSLGPPAAWNSTEDTPEKLNKLHSPNITQTQLTDYSPKIRHWKPIDNKFFKLNFECQGWEWWKRDSQASQ